MATHGMKVVGTGATTAGTKAIIDASISLPAGGPWDIHAIYGQVVKKTTVPNEGTGGLLIIDALSGDIQPNIAPAKYPMVGSPVSESVNAPVTAVPLNLWHVNWSAAGKAVLSLSYTPLLAITTASIVAAGVIFGKGTPVREPLIFCDNVNASFASATEQTIGTITLAEKATRIVGIFADLNKGDAPTAGVPCLATIRLDSPDVDFSPAEFPCNRAFNASDGTAVGASAVAQSQFIPVDIPVLGGAIVTVFATTSESVTGNADISVYLAYQ